MKFDVDDLTWDTPPMEARETMSAYSIAHSGSMPMGLSVGGVNAHHHLAAGLQAISEDPYTGFNQHTGAIAATSASAHHFHPYSAPSGVMTGEEHHHLSASLGSNGLTPDLLRSSPDDGSPENAEEEGQEGGKADDEDDEELRKRKPHKCDTCGACFARKVHLQRHALRHITCKPYTCDLCGKCFSRQDSLVRHHRLLHEREGRGKTTSTGKPLPPSAMRNRSPKACTRCSHLKTRCDGNEPCARCIAHGLGAGDCVYRPSAAQRSRSASSRVPAPSPAFVSERVLDEVESDDEGEFGSKAMAANGSSDSMRGRPLARYNAAVNSGSASSNGSGSGASHGEKQSIFSASYDDASGNLSPGSWASSSSMGAHFAGMHLQAPPPPQQVQHIQTRQRSMSQQDTPTPAMYGHGAHISQQQAQLHYMNNASHAQHAQQFAMLGISLPQQHEYHPSQHHGNAGANGHFVPPSHSLQPQQLHSPQLHSPTQYVDGPARGMSMSGMRTPNARQAHHQHQHSGHEPAMSHYPDLSFSAPVHTSIGFAAPSAHAHEHGGHGSHHGHVSHSYGHGAFADSPIDDDRRPQTNSAHSQVSSAPTASELMSFDWSDYGVSEDDHHMEQAQHHHAAHVSRHAEPAGAKPNPFAIAAYGQSMMLAAPDASRDLEMDGTRTPGSHHGHHGGKMHADSPNAHGGGASNMHSPSYGAHDALALSQTLGDADWEAAFRGR